MTGRLLHLTIEKIVYPGERLAHWQSRTVFTDEGLPGETVEAVVIKDGGGRLSARTVRILAPSPARIEPRCGHYRACGSYQPLPYDEQLKLKSVQLREMLAEVMDPAEAPAGFVAAPEPWNYRNRVRLRLVWKGGEPFLAYREPGSETAFVAAGDCHLVAAKAGALLQSCLEIIREKNIRSIVEIEARESRATGELLLGFHRGGPAAPDEVDPFLTGLRPRFEIAGILSLRRIGRRVRTVAEWGRDAIEEKAAGRTYRVGALAFFQVNTVMLDKVLDDIRGFAVSAGSGRMADLYCGVGTFGIALADRFGEVAGVESDPVNIGFLKANLELNGIGNYRIHEGRSEEWTDLILEKGVDLAVVDPPRKGLEPGAVRSLCARPPAALAYVSCHPATLVRDLRSLLDVFRIVSVRGYDFFPQTPHMEALALLVRK
jgi:23S rRNA (uracil1939-C5)-methyltransferase